MPRGVPNSGNRISNPDFGKPYKCSICKGTVAYNKRLEHAELHAPIVNCSVRNCEAKHKSTNKAKRQHCEAFHETECLRND